jgi:hypothetical protein
MVVGEERDIALSMIRLWGPCARVTAYGYAKDYRTRSDPMRALKWTKVGQLIAQIETPSFPDSAQRGGKSEKPFLRLAAPPADAQAKR